MASPIKQQLKAELVERLAAEHALLQQSQRETEQGATHEEAKPENDKDTRALEQSYLARGQAQRVAELAEELAQIKTMPLGVFTAETPIALGALVSIEDEAHRKNVFLAPRAGGRLLQAGTVHVVTPQSPLGHALIGKRAGDECSIRIGARQRELVIVSVE